MLMKNGVQIIQVVFIFFFIAGWDYDSIEHNFENIEKVLQPIIGEPDVFVDAMVDAAEQYGLSFNPNYNTNTTINGVAYFQYTMTPQFRRVTSYSAYLQNRQYPNLKILPQTMVNKVILEEINGNIVATGVLVNQTTVISANKEVILCAGAFGTPQILLLSGIGDADYLDGLNIPVFVDVPGVGENLSDDFYVTIYYTTKQDLPPQPYGMMQVVLFDSDTYFPGDQGVADIEHYVFSGTMPGLYYPEEYIPGYGIYPQILFPKSRGYVKLNASDIYGYPLINPNYLASQSDVDRAINSIWLARRLAHEPALDDWTLDEKLPGAHMVTHDVY